MLTKALSALYKGVMISCIRTTNTSWLSSLTYVREYIVRINELRKHNNAESHSSFECVLERGK